MPAKLRSGTTTRSAGSAASIGAADWLGLAAAPTFAIMALLTAIHGRDPANIICSAVQGGSFIGGMLPMYILMSGFHSSPWLRLIGARLPR